MSLATEVRPFKLDDFVGNKGTVQSLQGVIKSAGSDLKTVPHSFLFSGPSGCGKTTLARIIATAIGCEDSELMEINVADLRGIDMVRERIVMPTQFAPMSGARAYILDEAHQLSKAAQNCLLKPLEDCPEHVWFFLCTTEPKGLIETIRTRCAHYTVGNLSDKELKKVLTNALKYGSIEVDEETLETIVVVAEGCPRTALTILDQVKDVDNPNVEQIALELTGRDENTLTICRLVVSTASPQERQILQKWDKIRAAWKALPDRDPEKIRRSLLGYLRTCLLNSKSLDDADRFSSMIKQLMKLDLWKGGETCLLSCLFDLCVL